MSMASIRGMVLLVALGSALGIGYNALGLEPKEPWGLPWLTKDRLADLQASAVVGSGSDDTGKAEEDPYVTNVSDPRAILGGAGSSLPEIPDVDSPVQIERSALAQYVEARGALILDARESHEYEDGHIPGAVSLPFDEVASDTARLEQLDTGGRPIIVYCGGGACELSLDLAWSLVSAGHTRVAVFMGGYPEWLDAGMPVTTGKAP